MAKSIKNVRTTTLSTAVPVIDRAAWKLIDSTRSSDGAREAYYQLQAADAAYPAEIRIGIYPNTKTNRTNFSVKFTTRAVETDGSGNVILNEVANATLAFDLPGIGGLFNSTDLQTLLFNVLSVTYGTAPGAVPSTEVMGFWANSSPFMA